MSAYREKWGPVLERAGYTQICEGLLDGKKSRALGLSGTEVRTIIGIIRCQDNPNIRTVPSAKQLAYDSRVCYETTRKNLRNLTTYKKDGGKGLLIPVLLEHGRIRYNMMPLRRELEKLEQQPALEVVPAKVRAAPKPAPIVTIVPPDRDAEYQKEWQEVDENAYADWEEIKEQISEEISDAAYRTWIEPTHGLYRDSNEVLWIEVPSSSHEEQLLGRFAGIIERLRKLYGIASIACKVILAATVGV